MVKNRIGRILLALMMIIAAGQPAGAKDVFASLADDPHVECKYVSGRFAHNQKTWRSMSGRHAMNLDRGFSALWNYQLYSEDAVKKARKMLNDYLKANPKMELVMQSKSMAQDYRVYEKFETVEGKELIKQMIIWNQDASNVAEICVIDWNEGIEPTTSQYNSFNRLNFQGCRGDISQIAMAESLKINEYEEL